MEVIMLRLSKICSFKSALTVVFLTLGPVSVWGTDSPVEIRKISPPDLSEAHLGKRILCHRPMRRGTPNMSVEEQSGKVIIHNYGHGGSGWTLGPGSATYVVDLLEKSKYAKEIEKTTPITIVGAGALGLFTAYDLLKRGYKKLTVCAENFEQLTSHNAGGLLAPVSMDNDPKLQKVIDKIGIDAYLFYQKIAKERHSDFRKGAVIVPTYFENRKDSGLEPYVGKVMEPAKDVKLDFGNGTSRKMVAYDDGIFIDTSEMMSSLRQHLDTKVKFVKKKIEHFSNIEDKYIFNCTGIGSSVLNKDKEMVSVQGHLIMLKDQKLEDTQYMILVYFNKGKTESGQTVKRSFYFFPKRLAGTGESDIGVIGGTFIENATKKTPNNSEFGILLKGAKDFYGIS